MKTVTDLQSAQHIDDRPLFAPLRDRHATVWPLYRQRPHCTSACDQGRKPCATPDACLKPAQDIDAITAMNTILICAGYVLAHPLTWLAGGVIALAGLVHLAARLGWLA